MLALEDEGIEKEAEYYEEASGIWDRKPKLCGRLSQMGLDRAASENAAAYLCRQIAVTECLPDDKTIIAEHFCDHTGSHQVMIHSLFGRRINAPLSILAQHVIREKYHINAGCVDEEDGILLYPYGEEILPEGILKSIDPEIVREVLEAVLPQTPLFNITFRYNAARSLMMGMKRNGRQPLWMQRLKSTEMLDRLIGEKGHPLMEETRRECLENSWDIDGVLWLLSGIRSGLIRVHEVWVDVPSPMSLPLQWRMEAAEMYEYAPVTQGVRQAAYEELKAIEGLKPSAETLMQQEMKKLPENAVQLHSMLMIEGDLIAGELPVAGELLEELARSGQALYREPGLWIAAEQQEEYEKAFVWLTVSGEGDGGEKEAAEHLLRRMLYYRGSASAEQICQRYSADEYAVSVILQELADAGTVVESDGIFHHEKRYRRAQRQTIKQLRSNVTTQPGANYAALMAARTQITASPAAQLKAVMEQYCGQPYPAAMWEESIFPARVKGYRPALLDSLLAEGDYFWHLRPDGTLSFEKSEDIDWDSEGDTDDLSGQCAALTEHEKILYEQLQKRGAAFARQLARCAADVDVQIPLLGLVEKGLVCADSFVPVRQWQNRDKIAKATARQRVNAKIQAMSAGRWDLVHPLVKKTKEEWLEVLFSQQLILCRETFKKPAAGVLQMDGENVSRGLTEASMNWSDALEILRVWEYVGKVRRGYFVKGMSGAQFIRKEDFEYVTQTLAVPKQDVIWLHAADPSCVWGKSLAHEPERAFVSMPATAVALKGGKVAALLERKGKVLRVFDEECLAEAMHVLVTGFRERRLFTGQKRIVIKEYPAGAGDVLRAEGFLKEMQDYVLYLG